MKRILSTIFLFMALILIAVFALSPFASAATRYTDLSQLDSSATYTYDDMLAMYDFGYSVGYQDAASDRDATHSGTVKSAVSAAVSAAASDYVLNTSTKKFHYPSCASVGDMKPENTSYFTGSRDDVIAQGYKPCGRCKP